MREEAEEDDPGHPTAKEEVEKEAGSAKPLSPSSASATANHCRAALGLPGGELQVLGDGVPLRPG